MRRILIAALSLFVPLGSAALAETIVPQGGSLFRDHSARRVGDAITILIVESSAAGKSVSTKTKTEANSNALGLDRLDFVGMWNLDADNSSLGEGSTARRGDLQARMTARIIEIDDNGLLVVEGNRSVIVNGEEEKITLRGSVRPQNVQSDNTVLSTFLADASIEYTGEGVLASAERPGYLTRIMNWLF